VIAEAVGRGLGGAPDGVFSTPEYPIKRLALRISLDASSWKMPTTHPVSSRRAVKFGLRLA